MIKKLLLILIALILFSPEIKAQVFYHKFSPKQVALTFDDGPNPIYTEMVLDILKEANVKATFFVVGHKVAKYSDLLSEITKGGNEIGNHTYYHSRLNWLNTGKLLAEISLTSDLISQITNRPVRLFRPPHGYLPPEKLKAIEKAGYEIVQWSVNADDFYHTRFGMRTPSSIAYRVLSRTYGGDIILMHDDSAQTAAALPKIIEILKRRGYSFVTVSKLIGLKSS